MKKMIVFLSMIVIASGAFAQQRVPANMVTATNNGWAVLGTNGTLQTALNTIDTRLGLSVTNAVVPTNYAPRLILTGSVVSAYTPRWSGDALIVYGTNADATQIWQSWGASTTSWFITYPVQSIITTNATNNNIQLPRYLGDSMICTNAATNIYWKAFNLTTGGWKTVYSGVYP